METVIIALASFIPMLLLLVVVHELGHFWTAKAFGVKVLEFGIGYPPRAFGIYTGRTETLLSANTVCLTGALADIRPGQVVRVLSGETDDGELVAQYVEIRGAGRSGSLLAALGRFAGSGDRGRDGEPAQPARASLDDLQSDRYLRHEGRVREVDGNRIVMADMLYSLNWLPLGGFVRLSGENNPEAPRSLARRGVGQRAVVLAAGSAMNALFPIVAFAVMFMIPHTELTGGTVQITEIVPDSPAQAAGLMPGDRVLGIDGQLVETPDVLVREVRLGAGDEMLWSIEREGTPQQVRVHAASEPAGGSGRHRHRLHGG